MNFRFSNESRDAHSYGALENSKFGFEDALNMANNAAGGLATGTGKLGNDATLGNNLKFYGINGAGKFYGNQYVKTYDFSWSGKLGLVTNITSTVLLIDNIRNGMIDDGNSWGTNTTRALIQGSTGWGGAWLGAYLFGEAGSIICPGYGTLVGGIVGGVVGGIYGDEFGRIINKNLIPK